MVKKILSLTVAIMLFSVTALAIVTPPTLAQASEAVSTWVDGQAVIESITYNGATHTTALTEWDGTAMSETLQGDGSKTSPYQIANGADLRKFADIVNTDGDTDACAILTSDIDMGNQTGAAGSNWKEERITNYAGTFDGQGYTIYDLYLLANDKGAGLFDTISGGTVKNLNLVNVKYVNSNSRTLDKPGGGLCATLAGGKVYNVTVTGTVYNNSASGALNLFGGIAGKASGAAEIKNCYSAMNINLSKGAAAAAISTGNVYTHGIGGILGSTSSASDTIVIENCGFGGTINAPNNNRVAGIVGSGSVTIQSDVTITNCYNTGDITGAAQVAGILGWSTGAFDANIYNTGLITARGESTPYVAGLSNRTTKTASAKKWVYNSGDVQIQTSADADPTWDPRYAGMLWTNTNSVGDHKSTLNYYLASTYSVTDSETGEETTSNKLTLGSPKGTTTAYGNRITESDFCSAEVLANLNSEEGNTSAFAEDIGINGGKPILAWQSVAPLFTGGNYEVTAKKPAEIKLNEGGLIKLNITSLAADNAELTIKNKATDAVIATVSGAKKGSLVTRTIDTGSCDEIVISTTGRALISKGIYSENAGKAVTQLTNNDNSKIYKVNLTNASLSAGEEAVIIFVHYDSAGTIRSINYNEVTADTNAIASAIVNLSGVTVKAGDYLKAYFWAAGTLAPFDVPAQLNN